jgi:hypothetical protein
MIIIFKAREKLEIWGVVMKRWLQMFILLGVIAILIVPVQTNAYSYGDPNAEEVADTFKLVEASLNEATPNWKAAEEAYKVRRAEITSHFGESVSVTLDENFKSKDSDLLIANFKAVLVMNLERRFSNAKLDVEDYSKSKLLLAKALATFDTLIPYMDSNVSENKQAFDDALGALGNPGLFGVGKKEVQADVFSQKVDSIYKSVKPMFTFKAYIKPAVEEPVEAVKEPVAPVKPDVSKDTPKATPELEASTEPVVEESDVPAVAAEPVTEVEGTEPMESPLESTNRDEETAAPATAPDQVETVPAADEAHAPMEQTDKTNPLITVILIATVLIIGGGVVWFARKKGLF